MLEELAVDLLIKSVKDEAREHGGYYFLEYGRPVKLTAIAFSLLTMVIVYGIAISKENPLWLYLLAAAFGLIAGYLSIEVFLYKILFNDFEVVVKSPWRRRERTLLWSGITGISYSQVSQYYTLNTLDAGKIKISNMLSGKKSLFTKLGEKSPYCKQQNSAGT